MARKLRIEYPGAIYHVMNRGDRRQALFKDDTDRELFFTTLTEVCDKTRWQVHAYCLMDNHFHLVLETPDANLVAGMKWFLGTYTGRFNRRHKEFGHLFSGRYKSSIVDGSGNGYLKMVCDYVHLNPARANLLKPSQVLSDFRWSSFSWYLQAPNTRPGWLRVDRWLGEWRIPKDSPAGRRVLAGAMARRRRESVGEEFKPVERGWCLGGEESRQELLVQAKVVAKSSASHYGEIVREAAQARAEQIVIAGLKRLKWRETELAVRRKGNPDKVKLALALRDQTTMPLRWIAARLCMGTPGHLKWLLYQARQKK